MLRDTYVAEAIRTAPTLKRDNDSLILAGIGIAGEAIEAYEVVTAPLALDIPKLIKELGDVYWYTALAAFAVDIDFAGLLLPNAVVGELAQSRTLDSITRQYLIRAKNVSEYMKKAVFHSHPVDKVELETLLRELARHGQLMAQSVDVSVEEVLAKNIDKLRVRYPERFTTEGSLNKNEAAEG